MKSIKTFALTVYFFIGIIIPACDWTDPCDCSGYRYFDVTDMTVQALTNLEDFTPVTPGEQLSLDMFGGFYIDYIADYHACKALENDWSLSLMSSAYACSCLVGYDGSREEALVEFSVNTLNDFDEDHLAGSSINDLLMYQGSYLDLDSQAFPDFLSEEMAGKLRFEDMRLSLTSAPTIDSVFQIEVVMELSTGERYVRQSEAFVLLP